MGPKGLCWAGMTRKLDFINLSSVKQTVTLKVHDVRFQFYSCDGASVSPPFAGNWKSTIPGCWGTPVLTVPDHTETFTIDANSTYSYSYQALCKTRRGNTDCYYNPPYTTDFGNDLVGITQNLAEAAIDISVLEDRGALLTNIVAMPRSECGDFRNVTRFNIPVNGGRPY